MGKSIFGGVPLGYLRDGSPLGAPGAAPLCILGPPGSGKTTSVTINALLDEPGRQSFIVADAKNTVWAVTHGCREKRCGKENVKRANPGNLLNAGSDGWNPIKLDPKAPDFVEQAVTRTTAMLPAPSDKPDNHFIKGAREAFAAGVMDECEAAVRENREPDVARVRAMWTQEPKTLQKTIARLMAGGNPAITSRVAKFGGVATEELENIKSTIGVASSWMTPSMIADMQKDGVDFSACRDRPTTIFASLGMVEAIEQGPWLRTLFAVALSELFKKPGLKTTIIIEEGFVLQRLEILESTYAVAREANIDIVIVFQFLGQIKQHYPKTWNQFVSGTLLAFRASEIETAEFLSKRAGQEYKPVLSASDPSNPAEVGPRPSFGPQKRERIPVGQMFAMPRGTALVWLPGDDAPRIVETRGYFSIRKLNKRALPNPLHNATKSGGALKRVAVMAFCIAAAVIGGALLVG